MGINVSKIVDMESNYAMYGKKGYYLDPLLIKMLIVEELNPSMSYKKIEEFIKNADITITPEQIKKYLAKKMLEENPKLKEKLNEIENTGSKINLTDNKEESERKIAASVEKFKNEIESYRYYFSPYSLEYFKIYVSRLKEKLTALFDLVRELEKIKSGELQASSCQNIIDLDFHINEDGNLYYEDVNRLAEAIVYNVKDLYDKIIKGNDAATYLNFKISLDGIYRNDLSEDEIYPSKEIQVKNLYDRYPKEFVSLSNKQEEQLKQEEHDMLMTVTTWLIKEDEDIERESSLNKSIKPE